MLFVLLAILLGDHWLAAAETETLLFEEPFQDKLQGGWSWEDEDRAAWSIAGGKLSIWPTGGSWWRQNNNGKNHLIRAVPKPSAGEVAVEVFVENQPDQPYEHAGLVVFHDHDNYIAFNKEFIHNRRIVLWVVERAGAPEAPSAEIPYAQDGTWLRLRIAGTKITGQYRASGKDAWQTAGSHQLPGSGEPRIALHAGYSTRKDPNRRAHFSQFRILQVGNETK